MDHNGAGTALDQLPAAYAVAVRMRDGGAPPAEIAAALAIEPESVAPLLELADAKLARLTEILGTSASTCRKQMSPERRPKQERPAT